MSIDVSAVSANDSAQTITVTETDGTENKYNFTGIVGVTFSKGNASTAPTVTVASCAKTGDDSVSFGGTVVSKSK